MSISEKTRKILWGRSGNRCALCQCELVIGATISDKEAVVGDECHIVAREIEGPRGHSSLSADERDDYPNLILLCKVHHKLIDDQPHTYPVERLKEIKLKHEMWVTESLRPVEQVTLSEKGLFVAERIETGRQLLSVIGGSHASMFDNDEVENEREAEIIGNFLQGAQDYLDLWDDMGNYERTQAQFEYNKVIAELEQAGFLVYGTQRLEKYKLSTSVIDDWRVAYMLVKRKTNPLVAKKSAEFESRVGIQSPVESEFSGFILLAREQSK